MRRGRGPRARAGARLIAYSAALLAVAGGFAEAASAGSPEVKLYKSGEVRYAVLGDTQGPGSMSLDVECPVGTRLTSGGGSLAGTGVSSTIAGLFPFDTGDLDGDNDDGFSFRAYKDSLIGTTRLKMTAICLKDGQDGLVYAEFPDTIDAGTLGAGNIHACPASSRLVGAGLEVDAHSSLVRIRRLAADVQGGAIDPFEMFWSVHKEGPEQPMVAHNICMQEGTGTVRHVLVTKNIPNNTTGVIKAPCPGRTKVVGGGFAIPYNALASAPYDDADPGRAPDDGWRFKMFEYYDPALDYAQAFCLK